MRFLRITLALAAILIAWRGPSTGNLYAWKYSTDLGGGGYQQCRTCAVIAPATAFALVTLAAIIAMALRSESGHSGTEHTH